ncbi:kinase-like protein [Polychaeton citri CBS 116435]|uniref:Kinase-like protein n=1 Tax=Polychaeton citri CBS 116435 TaxID=1314669 RepID=A0A9P4QDZ4_9PEZI|nr:kinase-like protein [Polychaeton citri CBS 116435]
MAPYDLTAESEICRYLNDHHSAYGRVDRIERLLEGFAGFVYRVHLNIDALVADSKGGLHSIIVKHAEPYAARAKQWEMDPNRMDFEYNALQFYSTPTMHGDGSARSPKVLNYDQQHRVLIMEDAGTLPSVKGWFTSDVDVNSAAAVGSKLGNFLANLHNLTIDDIELKGKFNGNHTAKYLSGELYFGRLPVTAKKHGFDSAFIAEAAEAGRREVYESSEVLTHGDFWTGNILVPSTSPQLLVLDLELSKPGTAAFDVGQMAAEMYCLAAFRDRGKGMAMLEAFLKGYRERREREGGKVEAAKVAIRIGAHLLQIMPNAWGAEAGEERVKMEINVGVELIKMGWEKDGPKLRESVVRSLAE